MSYQDAANAMMQLRADLAPLELDWQDFDGGRFPGDGIQHTRRDGSVIVITDEGPEAGWLVGFYTAEQHADCSLAEDAKYVGCNNAAAIIFMVAAHIVSHPCGGVA